MWYCIEVDRGGIGEENMVLHQEFDKEPTRAEIIVFLENEDCGYDDDYCKLYFYQVS